MRLAGAPCATNLSALDELPAGIRRKTARRVRSTAGVNGFAFIRCLFRFDSYLEVSHGFCIVPIKGLAGRTLRG
jgi:hypothetical protein